MSKENEVSQEGKILRDIISYVSNGFFLGKKIKSGSLRKKLIEPPWKVPQHLEMTDIEMPKFSMKMLSPKEDVDDSKVILQLHGGGYTGAVRNAYYTFAGLYIELSGGYRVLTPDYRVAPENPFPAALEDAFEAYKWLQNQGYFADQIILAGDSAGGGLAMALCMLLKDKKMQLPCGIIAMSPWTDLTASGESYTANYDKDPLFGGSKESIIYNNEYPGDYDKMDPYISPMFGDFRDFPPMLLQVGSYEMLLSDSINVAAKARQQGVKVRLSIYEGMFHEFQMAYMAIPESKKAWNEVKKFIEILKDE